MGENDKATLSSMHNLAYCWLPQKEYSKATTIFEKVADKRISIFGEDERALWSLYYLAESLYGGNDVERAKRICEDLEIKIPLVVRAGYMDHALTTKNTHLLFSCTFHKCTVM